jgi:hypothetical protein
MQDATSSKVSQAYMEQAARALALPMMVACVRVFVRNISTFSFI